MLYLPRENVVYRFPSSELEHDTLRRARFLKLLPLPLLPEVFIDAVLYHTILAPNQYLAAIVLVFAIYRLSLLQKSSAKIQD